MPGWIVQVMGRFEVYRPRSSIRAWLENPEKKVPTQFSMSIRAVIIAKQSSMTLGRAILS
jgi:hypothetical protein